MRRAILIAGTALLPAFALAQSASTPAPPEAYVDRAVYPRGYSILTSERLLFPDVVVDWPVKIDSHRQLFVDDYLVASMERLTRQWHQPVKHPANPVIRTDRAWERSTGGTGSGCVLRDDRTGRFRFWYNVGKDTVLYAESDDGVAWRKPELGLIEHEGSKQNNIVIPGGCIAGLVTDATAPGLRSRHMAFVWREPPHVKTRGAYLHHSADGIRWTVDADRPVLALTHNPRLPAYGVGDTSLFRYDPLLRLYVCDAKYNPYFSDDVLKTVLRHPDGKNRVRSRAMAESDDLLHWTRPRVTIFPDEHDEPDSQMYGHISFSYESMWIGLLRVMHFARTGWKQVEIELTYSRDGRHWSRPTRRQTFIPLGPPESWEPDYSDPAFTGPVPVGDELWFYYRGSRSNSRDRTDHYTSGVGLARLRRDGFVSIDAGPAPGRLLTRPLTFRGRSLCINAEVADGGWVKAAVLSETREPLDSYDLKDAMPLTTGSVRGRMSWRRAARLAPPDGAHVRLLFELKDARLYSFWIE